MTKKLFKKIFIVAGSVTLLLVAVLCIHIWLVTRRTPPDANTRVMARMDIRQDINQQDADKITAWLYQQPGVDHVLCNADAEIVVFTYRPVITDADRIVSKFNTDLSYNAQRFLPDAKALKSGCPVSEKSLSYKLYSFFK